MAATAAASALTFSLTTAALAALSAVSATPAAAFASADFSTAASDVAFLVAAVSARALFPGSAAAAVAASLAAVSASTLAFSASLAILSAEALAVAVTVLAFTASATTESAATLAAADALTAKLLAMAAMAATLSIIRSTASVFDFAVSSPGTDVMLFKISASFSRRRGDRGGGGAIVVFLTAGAAAIVMLPTLAKPSPEVAALSFWRNEGIADDITSLPRCAAACDTSWAVYATLTPLPARRRWWRWRRRRTSAVMTSVTFVSGTLNVSAMIVLNPARMAAVKVSGLAMVGNARVPLTTVVTSA